MSAASSERSFEQKREESKGAGKDGVVLGSEPVKDPWAHVYTLRDGKIAMFRAFEDTAALVVAFDAG